MTFHDASLTNRKDIIADTVIVDKILANEIQYWNNTE